MFGTASIAAYLNYTKKIRISAHELRERKHGYFWTQVLS
jgi:hypothetical protein